MDVYLTYWQLILIIIIVIAFLVWLILFFKKKLKRRDLDTLSKQEIKKRWLEIEALLYKKDESHYRLAVLEADKLLDYVLKDMGFPGSSLGERLKVLCHKYPNLRKVWQPHKVRNQLVHEASYHLKQAEAKKAVQGFKSALKELGVL